MKIGIYGGSFNPPHIGHLKTALYMNDKLSLDKIFVVPSNISPQKNDNGDIDPIHRLNMCRLTFTDSVFVVSDVEIKRGGKSYTVETVAHFKREFPDDELFFFMGSDMLLTFDTWREPDEILKNCTVCAISREDGTSSQMLRNYVSGVLKTDKVIVFDAPKTVVSSTQIREKCSMGIDFSRLTTPAVERYIKKHKLYADKR